MERTVGSSDKLEPRAVEQAGSRFGMRGNAPADEAVGATLVDNQPLGHPRRSHRGSAGRRGHHAQVHNWLWARWRTRINIGGNSGGKENGKHTLWEKARVGWFERIALKHVYYHMWNRWPVQIWCMKQGTQSRCTQRGGMRREVGGGFGTGDTHTPVADSCQCMAKTTTVFLSN